MFSTSQLARRGGCSVQHVRDLEYAGVLPPADRSSNGYRRFGPAHVEALTAYRALSRATDADEARRVTHLAWSSPPNDSLAALDRIHARLHAEREALRHARLAVIDIAAETMDEPRAEDVLTISELAAALDVRASTLRHWEAEGLLRPARAAASAARIYSPTQVREARIVDQLRRGGYDIPLVRSLLPHLGRPEAAIDDGLRAREHRLADRTRALLEAGTAVSRLLDARGREAVETDLAGAQERDIE